MNKKFLIVVAAVASALAAASGPAASQSIRISDLPAASAATGTEKLPAVQSGITKAITTAQIATLAAADRQPLDSDLTSIAALSTTSFGRSFLPLADAAAGRVLLGGTTLGGNLFTLTNPGAITFPRFNADNTVTARSAANLRTDLGLVPGTDVQAYDADLAALAGLTSAADKLPYFTGSGTAAATDLTATARSLLDDGSAAAMRTTLGLGTMATEAATGYRPEGMHYPFEVPSGADFMAGLNGSAPSPGGLAYAADRLDVTLFWPIRTVTVTSLSIDVTSAGAGGTTAKIVIYADNGSGAPGALTASSSNLATDSTGIKVWTPGSPLTFTGGTKYWVGYHTSGGPSLLTFALNACASNGYDDAARLQLPVYRLTSATYGSGPPSPFGTGTLISSACPAVIFTVQ